MHPRSFAEFERICRSRRIGGAVLEVGAVPADDTLLCMKGLGQVTSRIGINLTGPHRYRDFEIVQGNANDMGCFEDGRFDAVLCNAVLEHDRFFWKTLDEIRRVTKPGGLIVIGTPGFAEDRVPFLGNRWLLGALRRAPGLGRLYWLCLSTLTLKIHRYPGDYYRFSPEAYQEVFFAGMIEVEVRAMMFPPLIVGAGRKPQRASV